ncbi:uncharacterized protein LOC111831200 [Capsella rubella]|uniref:uncharacterized protein LOC111831200 n=1 Tax=Capsella rubella TaxID=81985 RepID=UPI000CD4B319|nr:uncharacterized protein LOC111831200 [Capsella rubella]
MTVRRLKEIHKKFLLDIIFLMETKNSDKVVFEKMEGLNFTSSCLISPQGHGGGGLALFWKSELEINVLSSSQNFIDTSIKIKGKNFFATFVYGDPEKSNRKLVWQILTGLATAPNSPWYLTGDFIEIIDNSEKEGGPQRAEGLIEHLAIVHGLKRSQEEDVNI